MRNSKLRSSVLSIAFLLLMGATSSALANTITVNFGGVTGSGPYVFSYYLTEDGGGQITSGTSTPGATTSPGTGTATSNTTDDYFTIYDFVGFTGTVTTPSGWAFQSLLLGSTDTSTTVIDDPTIPNLTWYYTGSPLGAGVGATGFSATSIYGSLATGQFSTEDTIVAPCTANSPGCVNGATGRSASFTAVPLAVAVPEPGSMLLLGTGLFALSGIVRKRIARR